MRIHDTRRTRPSFCYSAPLSCGRGHGHHAAYVSWMLVWVGIILRPCGRCACRRTLENVITERILDERDSSRSCSKHGRSKIQQKDLNTAKKKPPKRNVSLPRNPPPPSPPSHTPTPLFRLIAILVFCLVETNSPLPGRCNNYDDSACVRACVRALSIVSTDKILSFRNALIISYDAVTFRE